MIQALTLRLPLRTLGVLLLGAVLGLESGCVFISSARYKEVRTTTALHVAGSGLQVKTQNGSVDVTVEPGTEVNITAELRMCSEERLKATTIVAARNIAGVLEIHADPPQGTWQSDEGCSFSVRVPDANGVAVETSNGSIELAGASGKADLHTGNGSVVVRGHAGELIAETSNGRIKAEGIAGPVDASTSNGDVTIALAPSAPGPVEVRSSNGSVTLDLGQAFKGRLTLGTSNGGVHVPRDAAPSRLHVTAKDDHSATLVVGDEGGTESKVRTSNGSITVHVAG